MISEIEKIFYNPGDLVRVRHRKLSNIPVMYVVEKVTRSYTVSYTHLDVYKRQEVYLKDINIWETLLYRKRNVSLFQSII